MARLLRFNHKKGQENHNIIAINKIYHSGGVILILCNYICAVFGNGKRIGSELCTHWIGQI